MESGPGLVGIPNAIVRAWSEYDPVQTDLFLLLSLFYNEGRFIALLQRYRIERTSKGCSISGKSGLQEVREILYIPPYTASPR